MRDHKRLYDTVSQLMQPGKGLLAADESEGTVGKRLAIAGLPNQQNNRQDFRELLFTAPGIEEFISGVIMFDSTIRSNTRNGMNFADVLTARGIVPGIKVDAGTGAFENFEAESVTQGLDNLPSRLEEYCKLGARFSKWRAIFNVGRHIPSNECMEMNATMMSRYAGIAQAAGLVPIVEPDILFVGNHSLRQSEQATIKTLQFLFSSLEKYKVDLRGIILKVSMVLAGDTYEEQTPASDVATATLKALNLSVPRSVPGILFLSGGQVPHRAVENLNAIAQAGNRTWPISYSFSRAIEEPVLAIWQGQHQNIPDAQQVLLKWAKACSLAQQGKYVSKTKNKTSAVEPSQPNNN